MLDLNRLTPQQRAVVAQVARKVKENKLADIELGLELWRRYPDDPVKFITEILGQLRERSWKNWRTVLKAMFAKPLDTDELKFFHEVAHRDPPTKPVNEVWWIVGRRAGKDSVASTLLVERARFGNSIKLRPGERALVACLASDRDQASIVYNYTKGYFEEVDALKPWLGDEIPRSYRSGGIQLSNKTDIRVTTNNFKAPRGYPIPVAAFDEVAFWRDENSAYPDVETYRAIRPGMQRYPNPLLIGFSTPYRKKGLLWDKYNDNFGKNNDRILVIQAATTLFNPQINQDEVDEDFQNDPEAAKAEWFAIFREDLEDYVPAEVIRACTITGRYELPYVFPGNYFAFVDPSGGSRDSFTLAIAHREGEKGVLDLIEEHTAPFQPSEVVEAIANTLRRYRISKVIGDSYAGEWPSEQFIKNGIIYEKSELHKLAIYQEALPLYRSQQVELLDNRRFFYQITSLERRTARGGRDSIDHPENVHDDVANAVCGALVGVTLGWSIVDVWKRLAS